MEKLDKLGEGDVLFLAGSIPTSMPDDMYQKIMAKLDGKGVMIVVDATRDLLLNVLEYHPFLIKPNNHELGEIFDVELLTRESVVPYAKKLQEKGARNVLVSMAGEGAVLVAEDGSLAMRVTYEEFSKQLCYRFQKPIVSTSANVSGEPAAQNYRDISEEILNAVDYVCWTRRQEHKPHQPSSIVKIAKNGEVKVIR